MEGTRRLRPERDLANSNAPCAPGSIPPAETYPPIALAVSEKTLLAWLPTKRMVPTTMTKMTANITAYSAMSCPSLSCQQLRRSSNIKEACPFL